MRLDFVGINVDGDCWYDLYSAILLFFAAPESCWLSRPIIGSDESCDRAVVWLTVESFCMSSSISWMCQSY